ncbi:PREDICTED: uncharacterized protein LOC103915523, partial [Pygoscelis adeliae]|uniref:uncharacterized protein LOC103915523 n=1 Tax=Pygoscelis adeliae TaxID=9238 RepID=UPI0004F4FE1A
DFHFSQCFGVSEPQEARLLLVQFHFDEPQSSKRLLACAKYCVTDERRRSASPHLLHVVLITKVPRVLGRCSYLAFDSSEWKSIHLDDLMPPENFKANLGQLSEMTIAEIFTSSSLQHLTINPPSPHCCPFQKPTVPASMSHLWMGMHLDQAGPKLWVPGALAAFEVFIAMQPLPPDRKTVMAEQAVNDGKMVGQTGKKWSDQSLQASSG